jgi:chorismate mutase
MSPSRRSGVRALRGATTAGSNSAEAIVEATAELLEAMLLRNQVGAGDLISIIFTTTPDLNAGFPAAAARSLGLSEVPLLCAQEIAVPGAVPRCIRVLMHLETTRDPLESVYLGEARTLRSDLAADEE